MNNEAEIKAKAKELVEKFRDAIDEFPVQCGTYCEGGDIDRNAAAKQCAVICVDEILKYHDECKEQSDCGPLDFMGTGSIASERAEQREYEKNWAGMKLYWQSVKQSILNQ